MDELFLCAKICCDPWRSSHSRQRLAVTSIFIWRRDIDTGWKQGGRKGRRERETGERERGKGFLVVCKLLFPIRSKPSIPGVSLQRDGTIVAI